MSRKMKFVYRYNIALHLDRNAVRKIFIILTLKTYYHNNANA
jgi:hypothetical protein